MAADRQSKHRDIANYDPLTDTSSVLNHRQFYAYGNITAESNATVHFLFAWTGRYFDEDTGLQNNHHRWYDAPTGQWLSRDPSGLDPDANPYRYTWNSPTNYTDPSGLVGVKPPSGTGQDGFRGRPEVIVGGKPQPGPPLSGWGAFWHDPLDWSFGGRGQPGAIFDGS